MREIEYFALLTEMSTVQEQIATCHILFNRYALASLIGLLITVIIGIAFRIPKTLLRLLRQNKKSNITQIYKQINS